MHLVLLETSGNQSFIFSTNKLRENVGASELTYRAGTQWLLEAVEQAGGPPGLWDENTWQLRRNLLNPQLNRAITDEGVIAEVILATSGKALLLVKTRECGQEIICKVTTKAIQYAPGLDLCGVISNHFEWEEERIGDVNRMLHERFDEVHANLPGPAMRFLRLPVVEDCATSGLPAAQLDRSDKNDAGPRSAVSRHKRAYRQKYATRMQALLDPDEAKIRFARNIEKLEEGSEWLAVIHADGNGLGEVFLNFGEYADCTHARQNRDYVNRYRRFSLGLDICTEKAFLKALTEMLRRDKDAWFEPRILPIVLGGDDLTVVCDGQAALQFTYDFLTEFEEQTGRNDLELVGDIIPYIAGEAFPSTRHLSACAGVAIVKPHFPFSAYYDLAEELIRSAKEVKRLIVHPDKQKHGQPVPWPCSAIDFHALYDSTATSLSEIRRKLRPDDGKTRIYGRPYVVTKPEKLKGAAEESQRWTEDHHWQKLRARVEKIQEQEDGRRKIPNSQLHDLRAGLHLGKSFADARFNLIRQRYQTESDKGIEVLAENNGTFFRPETIDEDGEEKKVWVTSLLDAMDAANFWGREE